MFVSRSEIASLALPGAALVLVLVWPQAWIIASVLVVISVLPTLVSAAKGLGEFRITIDLYNLLAVAIALILQETSSGAFIGLMLASARILEARTEARSHKAVEELLALKPHTARRESRGKVDEIPTQEIRTGDILLVGTGERIPCDGLLVHGTALVNEASVTGESLPREKLIGDRVLASTIIDAGAIKIRATHVGKDSTLERMATLIQEASRHKSGAEKAADQFAGYFLPLIGIAGIGLYYVTRNPSMVAAFFLVACADDVAVAIPLAITAALGRAAKRGIIVKGGARLLPLAHIDTIVLDKTGTLTFGDLRVERLDRDPSVTEFFIWECLAIAEKYSEHVIGRAVFREAVKRIGAVPDPERFQVYRGRGIWVHAKNHDILVGTPTLLTDSKIAIPDGWAVRENDTTDPGLTSDFYVAVDGRCIGRIRIADVPRPSARASIDKLRELGIKSIVMFTGDQLRTAAAVAKSVGIEEYHPTMSPEDKEREVGQLALKGTVVMIGDGINDAPALARSTVGIAMGTSGTAVAIEAADVVLLADNLDRLPELVSLAKQTESVIRGNVWIWTLSNLVGFALVLTGVFGPALAAGYNFITDFFPLANSARLFRKQKKSA
ncbi:cation-translocating P-type ATPase [Candidatus Uhrbacteria bacterium]|nr:cation-translocating P-type ATPase [Candidatus Uhrbacteria bacterium]